MIKYILNYDHKKPIPIYLDVATITKADEICEEIMSGEIDCYKINRIDKVIVPVYYYETNKGRKVIDEESMKEEFEEKLKELEE